MTTPLKAIKKYCVTCKGRKNVEACEEKKCHLYSFRLGINPNSKRKPLSEEKKQILRERLAEALKKRDKAKIFSVGPVPNTAR
jgi:hypothetical protein